MSSMLLDYYLQFLSIQVLFDQFFALKTSKLIEMTEERQRLLDDNIRKMKRGACHHFEVSLNLSPTIRRSLPSFENQIDFD